MIWKALGIFTALFASLTFMWLLWNSELPLLRGVFWVVIIALVVCVVKVSKDKFSE